MPPIDTIVYWPNDNVIEEPVIHATKDDAFKALVQHNGMDFNSYQTTMK